MNVMNRIAGNNLVPAWQNTKNVKTSEHWTKGSNPQDYCKSHKTIMDADNSGQLNKVVCEERMFINSSGYIEMVDVHGIKRRYEEKEYSLIKTIPELSLENWFDSKNNSEFVAPLLKKYPELFPYAGNEIKNNPEIVTPILKKHPEFFYYASNEIKNNPEIAVPVLKKYPIIFPHIGKAVQLFVEQDKDLILELIRVGMEHHINIFSFLKKKAQNDRDIVLAAVTAFGDNIDIIDDKFKKDPEIVLRAMETMDGILATDCSDKSLLSDADFLKKAVRTTPTALWEAVYRDKEFYSFAKKSGFISEIVTANWNIFLDALELLAFLKEFKDKGYTLQKNREIFLEKMPYIIQYKVKRTLKEKKEAIDSHFPERLEKLCQLIVDSIPVAQKERYLQVKKELAAFGIEYLSCIKSFKDAEYLLAERKIFENARAGEYIDTRKPIIVIFALKKETDESGAFTKNDEITKLINPGIGTPNSVLYFEVGNENEFYNYVKLLKEKIVPGQPLVGVIYGHGQRNETRFGRGANEIYSLDKSDFKDDKEAFVPWSKLNWWQIYLHSCWNGAKGENADNQVNSFAAVTRDSAEIIGCASTFTVLRWEFNPDGSIKRGVYDRNEKLTYSTKGKIKKP